MITTAYVIDAKGLLVTQAGSVRLIPWTSIRFIHVHVTSGVGSTGFPVYSARLRMLFASREISSLHWQGEARTDQSAGYVRFMEELIPFAIARNPRIRLRHGGDPMLEAAIPTVLFLVSMPFLLIPFLIVKPLGALVSGFKFFRVEQIRNQARSCCDHRGAWCGAQHASLVDRQAAQGRRSANRRTSAEISESSRLIS